MKQIKSALLVISTVFLLVACNSNSSPSITNITRDDGSRKLNIELAGSLQNPAFSPDGQSIVFTRFRGGYNKGISDLYTYHLGTGELKALVSDGSSNVNLPGSSWNSTLGSIVFSSEEGEHDEIYAIADTGAADDKIQITDREDKQSYEPSYSPDGKWVVFETHDIDVEAGVITKYRADGGSEYIDLTATTDNGKQPNWSPSGDKILYQKEQSDGWGIWLMDSDGENKTPLTSSHESATDAVFSFDGKWIIYSAVNKNVVLANIYAKEIYGNNTLRLTTFVGYDGAVSISPDASQIVFESSKGDPNRSSGTSLWVHDIEL